MDSEGIKEQIQFRFIIVPDFIIQDTSLTEGEKLLFGDIASNSLLTGYCWFSNKYLMQRFNIGERTACRWIHNLKKKGYIKTKNLRRKDSKEIEERQITINTSQKILDDYMNWYRCKRREVHAKNGIEPHEKNGVEAHAKIGVENNKKENNKYLLNLKDISNVILHQLEYQNLIDEFGLEEFEAGISDYSNWKKIKHAHPKSDFESLRKWLKKAQHQNNKNVSSVTKSGADVVTEEMLSNLPF